MQTNGASYNGIFGIIIGINDESLKQVSCERTSFSEKAARNHIQHKPSFKYIRNLYNCEIMYTPANPSFTILKWGTRRSKICGLVNVMDSIIRSRICTGN